MNEQLKGLSKILQIEYGIFIFLSLLICLAYETEYLPTGYYADNIRIQYILETIGIFLTIILVPSSLKLFSVGLKKIKKVSLSEAIQNYKLYSSLRILMSGIVVWTNLFIYYSTLKNTGIFCALIGLTASIFSLPTTNRIKEDLDMINKN